MAVKGATTGLVEMAAKKQSNSSCNISGEGGCSNGTNDSNSGAVLMVEAATAMAEMAMAAIGNSDRHQQQ